MLDGLRKSIGAFLSIIVEKAKLKAPLNSGKLKDSMKSGDVETPSGFTAFIEGADYIPYIDKGVKGKMSSSKAPKSPYQFGTGTGRQGGLTDGISKWVQSKPVIFTKENGTKLSDRVTIFLITRSIYNTGLEPRDFLLTTFEEDFDKLNIDALIEKDLDLEFNKVFYGNKS